MHEPAIDPSDEPTPDPRHPARPPRPAPDREWVRAPRHGAQRWPLPSVEHHAGRARLLLTCAFLSGALVTLAALAVTVVIVWAVTR